MKTPLTAALRLASYAAVTFAAVSIAWFAAKDRIAIQEQGAKIAQYREINPDIDPALLDHPETITLEGQPAQRYTAADGSSYYQTSTYKGYNGEIKLLIGIAPTTKPCSACASSPTKKPPAWATKSRRAFTRGYCNSPEKRWKTPALP